jgi:osmotically-inducible protein OsmY
MDADDYRRMGLSMQDAAEGDRQEAGNDGQLADAIRARFEGHPGVDQSRIHVAIRAGRVVLSGTAENRFDRERADLLAREVEGVQAVDNHLVIQSAAEAPGPTLTARRPGWADEPSTRRS